MSETKPLTEALVAGVDGTRGGWICVVARAGTAVLELRGVEQFSGFQELTEATSRFMAVGVDVPMGFSEDGRRAADYEARRFIGARRSSVFPPPPRALLTADGDYWALNAMARGIRAGISRQTYNILAKMREADRVMTPSLQERVREAHPEVSFCALNGDCLRHAKRTAAGKQERLALLAGVFGPGVSEWRPPPGAALDDLYDAAVLAWTAGRIARGEERSLPAEPPLDARGLRMEIVY